MSCAFFGPRHSPYSNYLCRAPNIAAVGTFFNIFSYDVIHAYHLPDPKLLVDLRLWVYNKTIPEALDLCRICTFSSILHRTLLTPK